MTARHGLRVKPPILNFLALKDAFQICPGNMLYYREMYQDLRARKQRECSFLF